MLKRGFIVLRKLTHQEIVDKQMRKLQQGRLPFCVVLNNIRSLYNVGSIFRTGDGVGVEKIWLCGITGRPPHSQISKTALGAENFVAWEYREDACVLLRELKKAGYKIVLLEQMEGSIPCEAFAPFPEAKVCLVVGNEIDGISDQMISCADTALEIGMAGVKNSLNVAVAFGIAAYQIRRSLRRRNFMRSMPSADRAAV